MKFKEYSTDDVPQAANIQIMLCADPACGRLHLVMVDENDQPIASATPGKNEDLIELLAQAKNLMAQIEKHQND